MFHTEQVDKHPEWYRGYDSLGPNEDGKKAYQVVAYLGNVQFNSLEEAEAAARKLTAFWQDNFLKRTPAQPEVGL